MTDRRTITASIALLASMGFIAGCGSSTVTDKAPSSPTTGTLVVEVHLSDERYLDCINNRTYSGHYVLDCDWEHPRANSDPSKPSSGTLTVFQKYLNDGRVLDCIAMGTYGGNNTVEDCDWGHAKHVTVS